MYSLLFSLYALITTFLCFTDARVIRRNGYPSQDVIDALEHLMVDTGGVNDGGFTRAITPCSNYVSGSQLLGRETAAQWIRVAFRAYPFPGVPTSDMLAKFFCR